MWLTAPILWIIVFLVGPGHDELLEAIHLHETAGGKIYVGDGGASVGPYHIGRAYWQDGTEYGGVNWPYWLVWSRPHCKWVMHWYWQRYGASTDEQRARMHNGGPQGHRRRSTLKYWKAIRRRLTMAKKDQKEKPAQTLRRIRDRENIVGQQDRIVEEQREVLKVAKEQRDGALADLRATIRDSEATLFNLTPPPAKSLRGKKVAKKLPAGWKKKKGKKRTPRKAKG